MYPGGAPNKREELCLSINSLISIRIKASSVPNIIRAKALANSVLPTPVGPKKI